MALHRIYYPKDSISESKQKEMASGITNLYSTANIPKFLITVVFIPIDKESFFVGGEVEHKMVQIMSLHYYAPLRKREWQNDFKERFEQAIEPFIREKGYQWQIHLEESTDDVWTLNGAKLPEMESVTMRQWTKYNRFTKF